MTLGCPYVNLLERQANQLRDRARPHRLFSPDFFFLFSLNFNFSVSPHPPFVHNVRPRFSFFLPFNVYIYNPFHGTPAGIILQKLRIAQKKRLILYLIVFWMSKYSSNSKLCRVPSNPLDAKSALHFTPPPPAPAPEENIQFRRLSEDSFRNVVFVSTDQRPVAKTVNRRLPPRFQFSICPCFFGCHWYWLAFSRRAPCNGKPNWIMH